MQIWSLATTLAHAGLIVLFVSGGAAVAGELKVLVANGMQTVMENLGPKFERASGHKLVTTYATGGAVAKRAQDGEMIDVVIAPRQGIDGLVKSGKASANNVTALTYARISVAVRKGAARPDISSPDVLKKTLLVARSITYLNPTDGGASGIHFAKVIERLGITDEMKPKTVFAPKDDAVGAMVADGQAEIGVIQHQLIFSTPGIDVIGPLPSELQDITVFSGAILNRASDSEASTTLLNFLRSEEAAAVIRAKGMEAGPP